MEITLSVDELLKILLYAGGIILVLYLIKVLHNLNLILKSAGNIIEKNSNNINETLEKLPSISSNVEKITDDFQLRVNHAKDTAVNIEKSFSEAAATLTEKAEAATQYIKIAESILNLLTGIFSRKGK